MALKVESKITSSSSKLTWKNQPRRHPVKPLSSQARMGILLPPPKWMVSLLLSG